MATTNTTAKPASKAARTYPYAPEALEAKRVQAEAERDAAKAEYDASVNAYADAIRQAQTQKAQQASQEAAIVADDARRSEEIARESNAAALDQIRADALEDQRQRQLERKGLAWSGLTEFASNLVNLGGAMAGAAPMRINPYTEGWRARVTEAARARQSALKTSADKYREMDRQLRTLQSSGRTAADKARVAASGVAGSNAADLEVAKMRVGNAGSNLSQAERQLDKIDNVEGQMFARNIALDTKTGNTNDGAADNSGAPVPPGGKKVK